MNTYYTHFLYAEGDNTEIVEEKHTFKNHFLKKSKHNAQANTD